MDGFFFFIGFLPRCGSLAVEIANDGSMGKSNLIGLRAPAKLDSLSLCTDNNR